MTGAWKIDVNASGALPQKVATAFGKLSEQLVGAEYTPIAYLGEQVVNGTNYAVLAEQLILTGKDTKNVVLMIFNVKPNDMEATLVNIERVVESGGELGGIQVDVQTNIPEEAMTAFNTTLEGFLGSKIEPFALLGTQVTKGTNYIFAAKVTPMTLNGEPEVQLITVNPMTKDIIFTNIMDSKQNVATLGYAFTWLKAAKPLGEWP